METLNTLPQTSQTIVLSGSTFNWEVLDVEMVEDETTVYVKKLDAEPTATDAPATGRRPSKIIDLAKDQGHFTPVFTDAEREWTRNVK